MDDNSEHRAEELGRVGKMAATIFANLDFGVCVIEIPAPRTHVKFRFSFEYRDKTFSIQECVDWKMIEDNSHLDRFAEDLAFRFMEIVEIAVDDLDTELLEKTK